MDELRDERQLNPFPWHLHWREWEQSEDYKAYHQAYADTETEMIADEVFPAWAVKELLFDYVHMPFEEAVVHEHPFVRAISLFDNGLVREDSQKSIVKRKADWSSCFTKFV